MFINQIFDFDKNVLNLYAKRQEILASNIANADTPKYKSQDIDFTKEFNKIKENFKNSKVTLKKTSSRHLEKKDNNLFSIDIIPVKTDEIKIDGNTVNMERERIQFLDNSLKYQSNLVFIKNEIKNIMRVLRG